MTERVIALVDMDCFYVQVEQRRDPSLRGQPCAVVQYQKWKGGGIIAVGYEARAFGVTRQMRGDDAKAKCPDIKLVHVPENRGKADISRYRKAGAEVIDVLASFCEDIERASVDEAYMDLTDLVKSAAQNYSLDELARKTFLSSHIAYISSPNLANENEPLESNEKYHIWIKLLQNPGNFSLAVGSLIVSEMRGAVLDKTGFTCSAGIAHNKILAKLVAGMNKPKQQTLICAEKVNELYLNTKISKVRNLGGKFGQSIKERYNAELMSDLCTISLEDLKTHFGDKSAEWVYWLCRGIDHEPVRIRQLPKSSGCSKNFYGKIALRKVEDVKYWLRQFAEEVCDRLEHERDVNERTPKLLTVSATFEDSPHLSRSCQLPEMLDVEILTTEALRVFMSLNKSKDKELWEPPIHNLGLSASKFSPISSLQSHSISNLWKNKQLKESQKELPGVSTTETIEREINIENPNVIIETESIPQVQDVKTAEPKSNVNTISNYALPSTSSSVFTADDYIICEKCGKRILLWDVPEHDDFHFASELQKASLPTTSNSNSNQSKHFMPKKKKAKLEPKQNIQNYFQKKENL